jgi:hypothetical protein
MAGRQGKAARRDGSFDAYDLVRRGATYAGKFDAAALPRTVDQLAQEGGPAEVSWRIAGLTDQSGGRRSKCVEAACRSCASCLQPFTWPVAVHACYRARRAQARGARCRGRARVILAAAPLTLRRSPKTSCC